MTEYEVGKYLSIHSSDEPKSEVEQALIVRVERIVTYVKTVSGEYETFKFVGYDSSIVNEDGSLVVEHQLPTVVELGYDPKVAKTLMDIKDD